MKKIIMKAANCLINILQNCGDIDFVDDVLNRVGAGETFTEEEMEEAE